VAREDLRGGRWPDFDFSDLFRAIFWFPLGSTTASMCRTDTTPPISRGGAEGRAEAVRYSEGTGGQPDAASWAGDRLITSVVRYPSKQTVDTGLRTTLAVVAATAGPAFAIRAASFPVFGVEFQVRTASDEGSRFAWGRGHGGFPFAHGTNGSGRRSERSTQNFLSKSLWRVCRPPEQSCDRELHRRAGKEAGDVRQQKMAPKTKKKPAIPGGVDLVRLEKT